MSERFPAVARATLDPAGAFGRHPLKPHQLLDRVTRIEDTIVLCHLGVPRIDPDDWSLSVGGLARRPPPPRLPRLHSIVAGDDPLLLRPRPPAPPFHRLNHLDLRLLCGVIGLILE